MSAPRLCAVVLAVLMACLTAMGEPTLDPYTVRSPAGTFALAVTPSNMDGAGEASYVLTRDGKPVWQGTRPFTLWEAAVTDDGTVCGYAYDKGYDGRGRGGDDGSALLCVIIDHEGLVRCMDAHERKHPPVLSNPPAAYEPRALGLAMDPGRDTMTVRAAGTFENTLVRWWTYRLSTGESLGEVIPEQPKRGEHGFHREMRAALIPQTPLMLVHWYIYERGARFAVLDPTGKEVWSLAQDEEYASLGEDFSWWWTIAEPGIEQTAVQDRGFDVVSYALKSRISYEAVPDAAAATGWTIKELRRVEDLPRPKAASDPTVAEVDLDSLGTIELKAPAPASPIRHVMDFNIDAKGRLGFIREWAGEQPHFVLVNPDGSIALDLPLDIAAHEKSRPLKAAPVAGERWVVARSFYDNAAPAAAWWLDVDRRALTPLEGFRSGRIEDLQSVPGGGFAVIGGYSDPEAVVVYDDKGQQRASVAGGQRGHMQAAAVRTDGSIALLMGIVNTIEYFDAQGKPVRTDSLGDALGALNYPSEIRGDSGGGLILHDFRGSPPVYRLAPDGRLRGKFDPGFQDGRALSLRGGVQCAPDGSLWATDGHALLRLNEQGVVDRVLGPAPDADDLGEVAELALGPGGRIYAVDSRTARVHVFDQAGVRVAVFRPASGDIPSGERVAHMAVASDRSVWLHARGSMGGGTYVGLADDGARLEPKPCRLDSITETWLFQPQGQSRWALGYRTIWLVNQKDEVVRTLTHRPSGAWLGDVNDGAVAPNGSLAVITSPRGVGMRGPVDLNIFAADGSPRTTMRLPDKYVGMRIAFNGRWVATIGDDKLNLYDLNTAKRARFTVPPEGTGEQYWYPCFSPEGSELWLRRAGAKTLHRFRLPG